MAGYLVDWSNRFPGKALAVVRPSTTEEVAAVLRLANEIATPVVPQSGNTSLVACATPDVTGRSIVLSMTRMNTIEQIDVINDTITVQAGVILAKAQEAAKEAGRFFPLSFGAQGSACLGGCLGTNAGGTGVLRYGNTRDLVLGLEAVLPDGRIVNMLRGLRKDNTGYDLKQLFVGSEGTLGVITRATLKLFPLPQTTYTALVGVADVQAACKLFATVKNEAGPALSGFELMQGKCIERVNEQIEAVKLKADVSTAAWWCLVELTFATDPGANPLEGILGRHLKRGLWLTLFCRTPNKTVWTFGPFENPLQAPMLTWAAICTLTSARFRATSPLSTMTKTETLSAGQLPATTAPFLPNTVSVKLSASISWRLKTRRNWR